ncbi:MAG TPA: hypothetical protein VJH89_00290 [Patescibacteria group bacterium]|nr:hypothetical protein [Patescibacteria group bacterium]
MWNPFKKTADEKDDELASLPGAPDMKDLNIFQRFAMRRIMKMSPAEREKVMKKAMTPKNIEKNKAEILSTLETMRKSGQISDDQYRLTKAKLGLK